MIGDLKSGFKDSERKWHSKLRIDKNLQVLKTLQNVEIGRKMHGDVFCYDMS